MSARLVCLDTNAVIRDATDAERASSIRDEVNGGLGAIVVQGRDCYVHALPDDREWLESYLAGRGGFHDPDGDGAP